MTELPSATLVKTMEGASLILRLDRPKSLNALNTHLVEAFDVALTEAEQDARVMSVIITGTGRAFCVGTDLKEGGIDADRRVRHMHEIVLRMTRFPKVLVAAINGLALGGGLEIALACTFRVAAPAALLGLPEITHSLMPSYGATQMLPRVIGAARALELALLGTPVTAQRALEIGLVTQVDENLMAAALALCATATQGSETAQRAVRDAIMDGLHLPLAEGLALEHRMMLRVAGSHEAMAGVAHFNARSSGTPS